MSDGGGDGGDDRIFGVRHVKAFAHSRLLCSTDTLYLSNGNSRVRAIEDSTDLETRELRGVDRSAQKCDNETTLSVHLVRCRSLTGICSDLFFARVIPLKSFPLNLQLKFFTLITGLASIFQ